MKLCIPVMHRNGLDSLLEPHLPKAENLLFFDTETRLCEEVSLREQGAGAGGAIRLDAVLCGSIDRSTLRTLFEQGVAVYGTGAQTVVQAIAQYENGELEAASPQGGGCGGHGGCCNSGEAHAEEGDGEHHCHGGGGCGGHDKESGRHHGHEGGGCCGRHAARHDAVSGQ